ncbi:MAG: nucleotidyltransferase domain-containing protein [Candidatus Aenigmarchaeota archaeon]|nr:nucleotidyltransferase domain-containing protein [Candidatus Aenigmarchaeota archaeon]
MKTKQNIILFLARNFNREYTINEISRGTNKAYSFINKKVHELIKEQVILENKIGKAILCSLNFKNEKTSVLLTLSEIEEREHFFVKNKELKLILSGFFEKIRNKVIFGVIFGSYAKGIAKKDSDIDLFILTERKINLEKEIKEIYSLYGKELSAIQLTKNEFLKQKDGELIKEVKENHIIFTGTKKFVDIMYQK